MTRAYWKLIQPLNTRHGGHAADVAEALKSLDEVRLSKSDPQVYLFYKSQRAERWVCAVTKRMNEEGFLITTYPTDAIKEGERIWPK